MEQPNTEYIDKLSGDNTEFKNKLITILKKELPEEINSYSTLIESGKFENAAESVHKLKHKLSILSLSQSYGLAEQFEKNLRQNNTELQDDFESILVKMKDFVTKL